MTAPYHQFDETNRRVVMAPGPEVTGRQSSRLIVELVSARPELADWDWVMDLRQASGEADNADVATVARAFGQHATAGGRSYTVFVTEDPGFPLWARTMDPQFDGRIHLTAPSVEAALGLVERRRRAA